MPTRSQDMNDFVASASGSLLSRGGPCTSLPLSRGWKSLGKALGNHWTDNSILELIATGVSKIYLLQHRCSAVASGVGKQEQGGRVKSRVSELGGARGNPEQEANS